MPEATGIHVTVRPEVHSPICSPSGEQTDWPALEHVPVDDDEDVVELEDELLIAEGAELGAAATAGEATTEEAAAIEEPAADRATDGATDGATDAAALEAAIEGATEAAL